MLFLNALYVGIGALVIAIALLSVAIVRRPRVVVQLEKGYEEILKRLDEIADLQKQLLHAAQARDLRPKRNRPLRNGEPWTEEEKRKVKESHEKGGSLKDIATRHERTVNAIRACLVRQGLIGNW